MPTSRSLILTLMLIAACVMLLTACSDQPLQRWETTRQGGVFSLNIDPTGDYAIVGAVHEGGSLWRLGDGTRLHDLNHHAVAEGALIASAFSPDSRFALTAEHDSVVMWDVASGDAVGLWTIEGGVAAVALSADGRRALIGMRDHSAIVLDTARRSPAARIRHGSTVSAVAISSDGSIGITGSDDGLLHAWNLEDGSERIAQKFAGAISTIVISPDDTLVFVGRHHGKGMVWNLRSGASIGAIGHDRSSIVSARFSADNTTLLTGFPSGRIILWDVDTAKPLRQWTAAPETARRPTGLVATDVAFGSGAAAGTVLNGFSDGSIMVWQHP